jgi:hypothetical protein
VLLFLVRLQTFSSVSVIHNMKVPGIPYMLSQHSKAVVKHLGLIALFHKLAVILGMLLSGIFDVWVFTLMLS